MWMGVLGCAHIMEKLVRTMLMLPQVHIAALGSRSVAKAEAFACGNHLPADVMLYGSYKSVLDDTQVDAVYIPLLIGLHAKWVTYATHKHKHVLLEKPMALAVEELDKFLTVLECHQLQFMDGTMFMHHFCLVHMYHVLHNPHVIGELCEVRSSL